MQIQQPEDEKEEEEKLKRLTVEILVASLLLALFDDCKEEDDDGGSSASQGSSAHAHGAVAVETASPEPLFGILLQWHTTENGSRFTIRRFVGNKLQ